MEANRYVVGFDGSAGARAALRWALDAAATTGRAVDAVAAWHLPVATGSPWAPLPQLEDVETLRDGYDLSLERAAKEVRGEVDGAPEIDVRVLTGFAGPALVDAAAGAHALVVGRRGRGGFLGLLLGSVADHCVHNAAVPVVLVPPEERSGCRRVVAGIDGSARSDAALRWAAAEAASLGLPLVALHAWSYLDQPGEFDADFDESAARAGAAEQVARVLGNAEVTVEVVNDLPARSLIERSKAGDLVVVGRRGMGAIREALLGSVSRQLAHHAPHTVVVVP
jgi:nucleotide-binding universal stress UspA family protein